MQIFVDTANLNEIKKAKELGLCDGITTNPTLISKEDTGFKEQILKIAEIVDDGPISAEVISLDKEGILKEARIISSWAKNIVVKIPLTPDGIKAVKILEEEGIKTNVTLVFSLNQAIIAAKASASYCSPFLGRLDDVGINSLSLLKDIVEVYTHYNFKTKIIAASIRHPMHVIEVAKIKPHIITMPFQVLLAMFNHPLTDSGIKRFLEDFQKVPDKRIE